MEKVDKYFILFTGTAAMFILAGGIVVLFILYQKKLLKEQNEKQQLEITYQTELLFSNINTLERERSRIATDLHDEIGSSLSAIRIKVARMDREANAIGYPALAETTDMIDQALEMVKRISYDLLPPGLENFGFEFAIKNLFDKVQKSTNLAISLAMPAGLSRFSNTVELSLYRILQELVNNTIKHAEATHIYVSIYQLSDALQISYHDNGKGYNSTNEHLHGLGLKNIISRTNLIRGHVQFKAINQGNNTEVSITINNTFL